MHNVAFIVGVCDDEPTVDEAVIKLKANAYNPMATGECNRQYFIAASKILDVCDRKKEIVLFLESNGIEVLEIGFVYSDFIYQLESKAETDWRYVVAAVLFKQGMKDMFGLSD